MTTDELRRALAICEAGGATVAYRVLDPKTGYESTLRALLEARELLRECEPALNDIVQRVYGFPSSAGWQELATKVRAFLAEGDSK